MALGKQTGAEPESGESLLANDERWSLIQRIVKSRSFERATQLRRILLYVGRAAILEPDKTLREYDIACEVLERHGTFDPANDNIVRSQFSHLRRKLELYFAEEGKDEPLLLRIPKGSYLPTFYAAKQERASNTITPEHRDAVVEQDAVTGPAHARGLTRRELGLAGVCLIPSLVLLMILTAYRGPAGTKPALSAAKENAFVRLLMRWDGDTAVVAPDTSLVLMENGLKKPDVTASEYVASDFPAQLVNSESDSAVRDLILRTMVTRHTSFNEAMVVSDFVTMLNTVGQRAKARYARDMKVSDFNEGNTILIGGPGSNPWYSLFAQKINFPFREHRVADRFFFANVHPMAGELNEYPVHYKGEALGYADVALLQNPIGTGYVLLISGSDQQEAESAAHLFLHGRLPPEIAQVLERKDLRSFEVLLRGTHIANQADNSFDLVAYRPH